MKKYLTLLLIIIVWGCDKESSRTYRKEILREQIAVEDNTIHVFSEMAASHRAEMEAIIQQYKNASPQAKVHLVAAAGDPAEELRRSMYRVNRAKYRRRRLVAELAAIGDKR